MRKLKLNPDISVVEKIVPRDFGANVRRMRREQNLTIQELANKIGCGSSHLTRIELGQRRVDSVAMIVTIAEALQTSPEMLMGHATVPGVEMTAKQTKVLKHLAELVTDRGMTDAQLDQLLEQATAYAEYCSRRVRE